MLFFGVLLVFWLSVKRVMHCFFIMQLQKDGGPISGASPEKRKKKKMGRKEGNGEGYIRLANRKKSVQLAEPANFPFLRCVVQRFLNVGC